MGLLASDEMLTGLCDAAGAFAIIFPGFKDGGAFGAGKLLGWLAFGAGKSLGWLAFGAGKSLGWLGFGAGKSLGWLGFGAGNSKAAGGVTGAGPTGVLPP